MLRPPDIKIRGYLWRHHAPKVFPIFIPVQLFLFLFLIPSSQAHRSLIFLIDDYSEDYSFRSALERLGHIALPVNRLLNFFYFPRHATFSPYLRKVLVPDFVSF